MTDTQTITMLSVMFYDDVENRDAYGSYRGMATTKSSVEFALPPQVGDHLYPGVLGAGGSTQALVTNVSHGPRFNGVGGPPEALVTVAIAFNQELVDHLARSGNWSVSPDIRS